MILAEAVLEECFELGGREQHPPRLLAELVAVIFDELPGLSPIREDAVRRGDHRSGVEPVRLVPVSALLAIGWLR